MNGGFILAYTEIFDKTLLKTPCKPMKWKYIVVILLFVFACSNPKNEQDLESSATPAETAPKTSTTHELLKKIIGNGNGLLRGFNFGDDISLVRKNEKLELFEQEKNYFGYTFDTPDLETIDILYGKDESNKLSWIQLDIYMNSDQANEALFNAFRDYYTIRYGKMTEQNGSYLWPLTPKGKVTVKKVKTSLDRGLEVKYVQ